MIRLHEGVHTYMYIYTHIIYKVMYFIFQNYTFLLVVKPQSDEANIR